MHKTIIAIVGLIGLGVSQAHAYTFDRSLPSDVANQMKLDLDFVASIEGSQATPLHQRIFGAVSGSIYKGFFESRINVIGFNSCGGGAAVACVIPWYGSDKMWVTKNYIQFSHPQVARLMVVFHESRHSEVNNGNWSHATCPVPFRDEQGNDKKSIWTGAPLAGEDACDETPFGSYGSSTIMLKNISKYCANCTDKVKMDASLYADDQMGRIIDAEAIRQMRKDLYQKVGI
ncbi:MAG: hypothetical protein NDJ90_05250 [Oligoflexia bacterium]|nr:hypothetical protein [Oligoflexia bacterium]